MGLLIGRRSRLGFGGIIWLVIGLVVAASKGYFDHLDTLGGILSALLAILVWPLVLLKVHFGI